MSAPPASSNILRWGLLLVAGLALAGLVALVLSQTTALARPGATPTAPVAPTRVLLPTALATTAPPSPAPSATPDPSRTPTAPPPSATPQAATLTALAVEARCAPSTQVPADWLTLVDREIGLERDFEPADLEEVPLAADNLSYRPVLLRTAVHQPLLDLVEAMNEAGLSGLVMSGYRSYSEQTLAYEKWQALYPDRAPDISAAPGHSEHQLGTAVDFSTAHMLDLYGEFFNVRFNTTPEGEWLLEHAARYGFTLSYPAWGTEQTGYAWEPWHFRYVGPLAQALWERNLTLTEYLRECAPR